MKKTSLVLGSTLLAATLLTQVACSGAPIVVEPPLTPRAGLSMAQVETAIRKGLAMASEGSTGVWLVERSSPGVLVAGIHVRGKHYLQVTFTYSPASVTSRITASEGLDQTADSINKRAITWHQRLDTYVQQALAYPAG